jgi:hypothetical protein
MPRKTRRLEIRCSEEFLAGIDDWRASQRPVPSLAAAIRKLALRGAAVDEYLHVILKTSVEDLIRSGLFESEMVPETYARWKRVVAQSLDQAAKASGDLREGAPDRAALNAGAPAPETPAPYRFAPKRRRGFR